MKNKKFVGLKGFAAGFVVCAALSTTLVFAAAANERALREIFFGVQVEVNGELVEFDEDMRPFIMDGRTFLPVRGVADALGIDVDWDIDTATVLIGHRGPIPFLAAAPSFNSRFSTIVDTVVTIAGVSHDDSISLNFTGTNGYSYHNLGGSFTRFSASIGSDDSGIGEGPVTIRIYGDGVLLSAFDTTRGSPARPILVDVRGVDVLRIFGASQSLSEHGRAVITNMMLQ